MRYGLAWRALRHRRGQAIVLGLLSGIVVAACASGPLYERAVEQASLRTALDHAPVSVRGLTVNSISMPDAATYRHEMRDAARLFGAPLFGAELSTQFLRKGPPLLSPLVSRTDMCAHLTLVSGRCPTATGEVMVSDRMGRDRGLPVGGTYTIAPETGDPTEPAPKTAAYRAHVVGWYRPPATTATDYWFDHDRYWPGVTTGQVSSPTGGPTASDAMFTVTATIDDVIRRAGAISFIQSRFFDAPLTVSRVGLDQLPLLRTTINRLQGEAVNQQSHPDEQGDVSAVLTGLPDLLTPVDHDRRIARSVVPLLAGQLALAALIVFAVAVLAAAEQRRPELALVRLRGGTRLRAARFLTREIGLLVAAGLAVGLLAAWLVAELACHRWLVSSIRPELRWPVLAAGLGSALLAILVVVVVALRTTGQPIGAMLRQVPPRRSRLGLGVLEAVVGALALAGIVVISSGSRDNPVAVVTPSLIGLLAGMIAGRVLVRVAPVVGRRALWRGRLDGAMAAFQLARRPGARLAVTLLCLTTTLAVFAADAWTVSARNRTARAGAQIGAPVVLHVDATSVTQLQRAVRAADPSGRYATPVIVQQPPGVDAEPVMAVDPAPFARIAQWGWPDLRPSATQLAALSPPTAPPIPIKGTTLQLRMGPIRIANDGPASADVDGPFRPPWLRVYLRRSDGSVVSSDFGPLVTRQSASTLSGYVSCAAGCTLSQLGITRSPTDPNMAEVDASIKSLAVGVPGAMAPVDLRGSRDWLAVPPVGAPADDSTSLEIRHVGPGIRIVALCGTAGALAQHLDIPVVLPALIAGPAPDARDELDHLSANNLDGRVAAFTSVGQMSISPRLGARAMLVDMTLAARSAGSIADAVTLGESDPMVWLGRDKDRREHALVTSLARAGVHVTARETSAARLTHLSASAPAWSMQLAITTGIIAALTAAGLLVMGVAATRRSRRDDLSALRVVGASQSQLRRGAVFEQLVVVICSVVIGAAVGLIGAHLALPSIPIFVDDQPVPPIRLHIAWPAALIATGLLAAGLGLTSTLAALRLTRSVGGHQLREGQR
jgi:hypothetical protein